MRGTWKEFRQRGCVPVSTMLHCKHQHQHCAFPLVPFERTTSFAHAVTLTLELMVAI